MFWTCTEPLCCQCQTYGSSERNLEVDAVKVHSSDVDATDNGGRDADVGSKLEHSSLDADSQSVALCRSDRSSASRPAEEAQATLSTGRDGASTAGLGGILSSVISTITDGRRLSRSSEKGSSVLSAPSVDVMDERLVPKVFDAARRLLPNGTMTEWQESWCTPEIGALYLRSRSGDIDRAAEGLAYALQWREERREVLVGERIPEWQGDMRVLARGVSGHPIIYTCFRHQPPKPSVEDTVEHFGVVLEAACLAMRKDALTFDMVLDCHGFRLGRNLDPRPTVALTEMLKHPFKGRLRVGFIVEAPLAFNAMWKVGARAMSEVTRQKMRFVTKQEALAELKISGGDVAALKVERVMEGNRTSGGPAISLRQPSEIDESDKG